MSMFRSLLSISNGGGSILPPEYQQVEYIQSTGTQYINTGIVIQTDTYFEVDYLITNAVDWETIIGTDNINTANRLFYGVVDGSNITKNYFYIGRNQFSFDNNYAAINVKTKATFNNNQLVVENQNGTLTKDYTNYSYSSSSYPFFLFALNRNGQANDNAYAKIYYAKIKSGSTTLGEFIPCYRKSDDTIGMYNITNDVFYTNAGTGTFIKGADV